MTEWESRSGLIDLAANSMKQRFLAIMDAIKTVGAWRT